MTSGCRGEPQLLVMRVKDVLGWMEGMEGIEWVGAGMEGLEKINYLLQINYHLLSWHALSSSSAGWTPLMYASYVGHDTIVNLLLDAGVKPSFSTPTHLSPLMVAAGCGNESVCYFLIQVSYVVTITIQELSFMCVSLCYVCFCV